MTERVALGIDIGTSALKMLALDGQGRVCARAREGYREESAEEWLRALRAAAAGICGQIDAGRIAVIGFSSQVGTNVIDGHTVLSWNSTAGEEELRELLAQVDNKTFRREISFSHPELGSYPLPRLLYIKKHFGTGVSVLGPKELLIRTLTGKTVTDRFSGRGLVNQETGRYSETLLRRLGLSDFALPPVKGVTETVGRVTEEAAALTGLPAGIPVVPGCNDFYAGLLGMGVTEPGQVFELSGTSEHLGVITDTLIDGKCVSSPYFSHVVTYGGTKSSGRAVELARRQFALPERSLEELLPHEPPLFLPYLSGERAPIFDADARGVFFGLLGSHTPEELGYGILEGVVFSLYDIFTSLGKETPERVICAGGSSVSPFMNRLRAELFGCAFVIPEEKDSSALGAALLAGTGSGLFSSPEEGIRLSVRYGEPIRPEASPAVREQLRKRFAFYKKLYRDLRPDFALWREQNHE